MAEIVSLADALRGNGPQQIITDLGVLTPDPQTCEFTMTSVFGGVSEETIRDRTGWDLRVAAAPGTVVPPSAAELAALRGFRTTGD